MQHASDELISLLAIPRREHPASLRVTFGIIDPTVPPTSTATATSQTAFSDVRDLMLGVEMRNPYETLERNSLILGGGGAPLPKTGWQKTGLTSSVVSRADGTFATNPKITITSTAVHSTIGLGVLFDRFRNNWCSYTLRGYYNTELIATYLAAPDGVSHSLTAPIDEWNRLEIEFTKTSVPYRRVRVGGLTFGLYRQDEIFTGVNKHEAEVSPISDRLPVETFEWTLTNFDREFQPGQGTGLQKYVMEQQPVLFEWGYPVQQELFITANQEQFVTADGFDLSVQATEFSTEHIEWVTAANYWTTGTPKFSRHTVTLKATGLLSYMTDIYYKGLYRPSGITLHALALEVLLAAEIPLKPDGTYRWKLWEGLKDYYTTAPLPKRPGRELLQLIANCAGCVFLPDRSGDIVIGPKPVDEATAIGQFGTFRFNGVII